MNNFTTADVESFTRNPIFKAFMQQLKESAHREWETSINATDREILHQRIRILIEFDSWIRTRLIAKPDKAKVDY